MYKKLTNIEDPFDKAQWYMRVVLPREIAFCKTRKLTPYIKGMCIKQSRLRAKRACDIAYRMSKEPLRFAPYKYLTRVKKYNATSLLENRHKANVCYVLGGNDLYQIRTDLDKVQEMGNFQLPKWLYGEESVLMTTEGYMILAVILITACGCFCTLCTFCCADSKRDKWKVKSTVHVQAPLEWVWQNYPQQFDMTKIFGFDGNKRPVKEGVVAQFPSEDFPRVGSHITLKLQGGGRVSEKVSIKDDSTHTYQTIRQTCFQTTISTMVFSKVSPSKSEIEWEVEVKPKTCGSLCVSSWMENHYQPLHKEHFSRNLRFEINKKFFATVEVNLPSKKPLHSKSVK